METIFRLIFAMILAGGIAAVPSFSFGQESEKDDAAESKPSERSSFELVATRNHDRNSYCQGLFYEFDEKLQKPIFFESAGRYGKSRLKKVDVQTGRTLQEINLPKHFFAEGLAVVGDRIYLLTWRERTCLVFDKETFRQLDEFRYSFEGWGTTFDGQNLVVSDGSSLLRFIDPKTFKVEKTLDVYLLTENGQKKKVRNLNELEFIEGQIWANVFLSPFVVRIDPTTGEIVELLNFQSLIPQGFENNDDFVLNGLAYRPDDRTLFMTGKCWPVLYEMKIKDGKTAKR